MCFDGSTRFFCLVFPLAAPRLLFVSVRYPHSVGDQPLWSIFLMKDYCIFEHVYTLI